MAGAPVIPKIGYGTGGTYGLIRYLFGAGKRDEHTDQHLVASWNDYAPDPGRNPQHTIVQLAGQLDQPVRAIGDRAPATTFWHCSVRADPGDRHLDDADWAAIARRIVTAVGIAPEGDTTACRWVAVRHAEDHIHIAATLVRQDGRRADLKFDQRKAQAEARQIEKDYGLRQLNPGDGTAAKNPTSQERFKAERTGRPETPRETLREAVRQALAGAATEAEFFTRLRDKGLRIKLTEGSSGDVLGYAVALPGDRNAAGEPIWFAGSTLAADLSLPRIQRRLADGTADQDSSLRTEGARQHWSAPARGRRTATGIAERAVLLLDHDSSEAAAQLVGTGELLDAIAQISPAPTRAELAAAARSFERATRSHTRAEQADTRAMRIAARGIIRRLVPDVAGRDVYLCGPSGMTDSATRHLRQTGVPTRPGDDRIAHRGPAHHGYRPLPRRPPAAPAPGSSTPSPTRPSPTWLCRCRLALLPPRRCRSTMGR